MGAFPAPDFQLLQTHALRLPAELQICFCFLAEERMLREEGEGLEEDPFSIEFPFAEGYGVD